ncbi:hypothetical protein [Aeoliella sp.]|uniref:hypothetical protein n=1 Tax=Aeoliella sp. TaxID=2795800 RepID=UPI003CCBC70B
MNAAGSVPTYALAGLIIASCTGAAAADAVEEPEVHLKQVVAYTSGVAFFERAGEVDGDADLVLEFPTEGMDDLLKSLVLLDLDGGKASTVTYENRDPVARSLGTLPFALQPGAGLGDILQQFRGQRIVLGKDIEGRIVSVETQTIRDREQSYDQQLLLVQTDDGLRRIPLAEMTSVKLVDPEVQERFQRALELLAMQADSPAKRVTLQFRGEGKRRVRIGYVQEFPVWKVSYRLVMDDAGEALLQGWAMVENTTDQDWREVGLSLVSGQPFAFRMNLYEPLYVQRPQVQPSSVAGLVPREYGLDFAPSRRPGGRGGSFGGGGGSFGGGGFGGGAFGGGGFGFGGSMGEATDGQAERSLGDRLAESQPTMASASEVGELFHYEIDSPVTLASETSAMLPIVNAKVKGEKLSLYDPSVNAKHPQHGVRLTNTTDLHLMRGPITVLDDAQYAGDSRMADTPPGAERLITFAMDPEVDVEIKVDPPENRMIEARLVRGVMLTKHRVRRTSNYQLKNQSTKPRLLVIERSQQAGWDVVEPEVTKTTDNSVRFEVSVPAGELVKLPVVEQQINQEKFAVEQLSDDQLAVYLHSPLVDEQAKQTLEGYQKHRVERNQFRLAVNSSEAELRALAAEQERIGKSMDRLDRNSELYQRFVTKLDELETRIERERARLAELRKQLQNVQNKIGAIAPFEF